LRQHIFGKFTSGKIWAVYPCAPIH